MHTGVYAKISVGAVGLGDNDKQRTAEAEAAAKKETERKQEMREREKKVLHNQKEAERQNIRSKYQLPNNANKRTQDNKPKGTTSPNENKCAIS